LEYERAERLHESERRKDEAARAKERQRRDLATAKAKAALEKAEREHDGIATAIEADRAALEKRASRERPLEEAEAKAGPRRPSGPQIAHGEGERPQDAPARAAVAPRQSDPGQDKKFLTPS
jgi:hypothetical protein